MKSRQVLDLQPEPFPVVIHVTAPKTVIPVKGGVIPGEVKVPDQLPFDPHLRTIFARTQEMSQVEDWLHGKLPTDQRVDVLPIEPLLYRGLPSIYRVQEILTSNESSFRSQLWETEGRLGLQQR